MIEAAAAEPGAVAFTDIVGFTEFTAARGDMEALAVLDLQERIVSAALPPRARIVKELGDGLMLWLPYAPDALAACLELLDRFREVADEGSPLWVRMGMHWGCPRRRRDDLIGHDVNLAARIVDLAGPGELLVSVHMRDAARDSVDHLQLDELGPVVMRGIPEPVRLFRVQRPMHARP